MMLVESVGDLLAVDPSLNAPGAALFRGGVLISAARVRVDPDWAKLDLGERAARVAEAVLRWGIAREMTPRTLVYERPQVYAGKKSKGDPNDLIAIALVAANVSGALRLGMAARDVGVRVFAPTPHDWIGNVRKTTTGDAWASPRGARVRMRLSNEEILTVEGTHDAIDAAGLGLWALGRLDPHCVYPGAADA